MNRRALVTSAFILIFSSFYSFSQVEFSEKNLEAVVKTPFPIQSICWNNSDELFAYSEGNIVFVRNAADYEVVNTFEIENVQDLYFSKEGSEDVLLTLYNYGTVSIWNLFDKNPLLTESYDKSKLLSSVAFTKDSNYIATPLEDYSINLHFKLRYIRETIVRNLKGHSAPIYNLAFSDDSRYLASASEDGKVIIWNCDECVSVSEYDGIYTKSKVPLAFSCDGSCFFACDSEKSFAIIMLDGTKVKNVNIDSTIKKIQPLQNKNVVAVLTTENVIKLYNVQTDKFLGYIPAYNVSDLTDFTFSSDDRFVLVGFADGSIYKLLVSSCLLPPDKKLPRYILVQDGEVVVKGSMQTDKVFVPQSEAGSNAIDSENSEKQIEYVQVPKDSLQKDIFVEQKPTGPDTRNVLFVYADCAFYQKPFFMGPDLGAEVRFVKPIKPFYFGGGFECGLAFTDSSRCDYSYAINGQKQRLPFLVSSILYAPFGILIPLKSTDIQLVINVKAGVKLNAICFASSKGTVIGQPYFCGFVSGTIGIQLFNFELNTGCKYDFMGKPTFFAGVGYNIKLGKRI